MRKTITLPFPGSKLMPNRTKGVHWGVTSKLKKNAKDDAYYRTAEAGLKNIQTRNGIKVMFYCRDSRKRDADNLLASLKSALDGVAMALGVDDEIFCPITIDKGIDPKRPRVEITLELA